MGSGCAIRGKGICGENSISWLGHLHSQREASRDQMVRDVAITRTRPTTERLATTTKSASVRTATVTCVKQRKLEAHKTTKDKNRCGCMILVQ